MQSSLRSRCIPAAAGDTAPPGLAGLAQGFAFGAWCLRYAPGRPCFAGRLVRCAGVASCSSQPLWCFAPLVGGFARVGCAAPVFLIPRRSSVAGRGSALWLGAGSPSSFFFVQHAYPFALIFQHPFFLDYQAMFTTRAVRIIAILAGDFFFIRHCYFLPK